MRVEIGNEDDWREVRRGKLTASVFHRVMNGTVKGHTSLLETLRAAEPMSEHDFKATCWGRTHEPEARAMFALVEGVTVEPPPIFYLHDEMPEVGASPDGMVGDCPVEIKCAYNQDEHARRRPGIVPEHVAQMQGQIWITHAPYGYYVAYDPRVCNDDGVKVGELVSHRIERDQRYIDRLASKVTEFVGHLRAGTNPEAFDVMSDDLPKLF